MLINLSNHPLKYWIKKQIETANKLYGNIVDLPFPQINPEWDETEIEKLSKEYFNKIILQLGNAKSKNNAVHIMGELTFTFNLVNKLLKNGIVCVASTTERKTKETDNKKISEFNFVRFRKYVK